MTWFMAAQSDCAGPRVKRDELPAGVLVKNRIEVAAAPIRATAPPAESGFCAIVARRFSRPGASLSLSNRSAGRATYLASLLGGLICQSSPNPRHSTS
jgi:hypothetical protein